MTATIGIDIGSKGAVALLTPAGDLLEGRRHMPTLRDGPKGRPNVSAALLADIVFRMKAATAYVEFVGARPGEGAVGAFAFGRSRGVIEGICGAAGVRLAFLTPACWRTVGIPPGREGAKDAARSEAIRRWPGHAATFGRIKDDGRAEAFARGVWVDAEFRGRVHRTGWLAESADGRTLRSYPTERLPPFSTMEGSA